MTAEQKTEDEFENNDIVTALPDPAIYYALKLHSNDWMMILSNWLSKQGTLNDKPVKDAILAHLSDGSTTMYLRKERFPAHTVAAVLGTTPDKLRAAKNIDLKHFKAQDKWEKPTVSYWGMA